jgi:hypothetical protein
MADKKLGLVGTYKYAAGKSRSLVFKSYVLISSMIGIFIVFLIVLAGITWTANPTGTGPFREQIILGAILLVVIIPLFAPVFVVSRRQQKNRSTAQTDCFMALVGYEYIVSFFIGLGILDPNNHKLYWPLEGVGRWVDSLPGSYGVVLIILSICMIAMVERKTRKSS